MDDLIAQADERSRQAISSIEAGLIDPPDDECPNCGSNPLMYDEEGFCLSCNNTVMGDDDDPRDEHDPVRDQERKEDADAQSAAEYEAGI